MKFTKYDQFGAYHWGQYDKGTKYKVHADRVKDWIKESSVLDIGAGDGKITSLIKGAVGIDNEPTAVKLSQEKGVNVVLGDAYHLPYMDKCFDSALMADVLEHFEFPDDALEEAKRVLKKYLYITTPPKRDDGKLTDKFHYIEWTPEELVELVEKHGFVAEHDVLVFPEEKVMYAKFRRLDGDFPDSE